MVYGVGFPHVHLVIFGSVPCLSFAPTNGFVVGACRYHSIRYSGSNLMGLLKQFQLHDN
jgi:hypothetical protein